MQLTMTMEVLDNDKVKTLTSQSYNKTMMIIWIYDLLDPQIHNDSDSDPNRLNKVPQCDLQQVDSRREAMHKIDQPLHSDNKQAVDGDQLAKTQEIDSDSDI